MKEYNDHFHEALLRMFPTVESFNDFRIEKKDGARSTFRKLADIGYVNKHINEKTEAGLVNLIKNMSLIKTAMHHDKISFSEMLNQIAQGASINSLVDWINTIAEELDFPKVQASMITRMKLGGRLKTTKQKWILRLLAFWVGLKRPHLPYNYHSFIASFDYTPIPVDDNEDEGVRIDFTFAQNIEIIDFQMVDWLKNELLQCIKDLNLYAMTGDRVKFYSTTTATLVINKDKGPSLEPRLYSQAVRCALVIAQQIVVRWAISTLNKRQNPMIVGIGAGKFPKLPWQLQALISARLEDNFNIRMTDFAKLCACLTDTKVIFNTPPTAYTMINGDIFTIWSVRYFWFLYYDYIPRLLDEDMLPSNKDAYNDFSNQTHFPKSEGDRPGNLILQAIRKFPQQDVLLIETAKVCLAKRMFTEANNILLTIFASDPYNPVARSLRMLVFLNMSMNQTDYGIFELYFDRAKKEGDFVLKYCREDEEIWCEYGLLFWTRAIYILRRLRKNAVADQSQRALLKDKLLSDLKEAEICFQNGMIFSPTVNRPGFWIVHLRSLIEMIKFDDTITESTAPIKDPMGIYGMESIKFFISLGWIDPAVLTIADNDERLRQLNLFMERMSQAIQIYYGSVHLRMYKPNVAFSIATVLWDFSPMITVGIAKSVLEWLEKSRISARRAQGSKTGLFSIVSWYSQIQHPDHFIECVTRAIDHVHSIVKNKLHLHSDTLIDGQEINGLKLFPMFFDEHIPSCVLFS